MPAFRAERVKLTCDLTHRHALAVAGALGWTVPGDNSGLAAAHDFVKVQLDSGPRLDVRKSELAAAPWPTVDWESLKTG